MARWGEGSIITTNSGERRANWNGYNARKPVQCVVSSARFLLILTQKSSPSFSYSHLPQVHDNSLGDKSPVCCDPVSVSCVVVNVLSPTSDLRHCVTLISFQGPPRPPPSGYGGYYGGYPPPPHGAPGYPPGDRGPAPGPPRPGYPPQVRH